MPKKYANSCNKNDHKQWSRRSFLQALGLASGASIMLGKTALAASQHNALNKSLSELEHDRILVLCRLRGGNDGINTIIPLDQYDAYIKNRPTIHIPENQLITLKKDELAIPDTLAPLERLWQEQSMKIINGVGYEKSNLSHAKSAHIWYNTDVENRMEETGWMGRALEELHPDFIGNPPDYPPALKVGGGTNNMLFRGQENQYAYTFGTINRLEQVAENGSFYATENNTTKNCTYENKLRHIQNTTNFTTQYAKTIHKAYQSSSSYSEGYATDN